MKNTTPVKTRRACWRLSSHATKAKPTIHPQGDGATLEHTESTVVTAVAAAGTISVPLYKARQADAPPQPELLGTSSSVMCADPVAACPSEHQTLVQHCLLSQLTRQLRALLASLLAHRHDKLATTGTVALHDSLPNPPEAYCCCNHAAASDTLGYTRRHARFCILFCPK